jgi:ferrous iron transport protein A
MDCPILPVAPGERVRDPKLHSAVGGYWFFDSRLGSLVNTQSSSARANEIAHTLRLDELKDGEEAIVDSLRPHPQMTPELLRRLAEIGFIPGERVRVMTRGWPGGTPVAVRVGTSTFALRRIEAQSVVVVPQRSMAGASR